MERAKRENTRELWMEYTARRSRLTTERIIREARQMLCAAGLCEACIGENGQELLFMMRLSVGGGNFVPVLYRLQVQAGNRRICLRMQLCEVRESRERHTLRWYLANRNRDIQSRNRSQMFELQDGKCFLRCFVALHAGWQEDLVSAVAKMNRAAESEYGTLAALSRGDAPAHIQKAIRREYQMYECEWKKIGEEADEFRI